MDKLILVLYYNVGNMLDDEINELMGNINKKMFNRSIMNELNAISYILPIRDGETRLELLNPKFIVDNELYDNTKIKLEEINNYFKKIYENEKN
jgi:hypothetical protein